MAEEIQKSYDAEDLEQRAKELEEREKELEEKENKLKKAEDKIVRAKYNLYERIDVSLETMNKIVVILAAALAIAVLVGIVYR